MRRSKLERLREKKVRKFNEERFDFWSFFALLVDLARHPPEERIINPTQKLFVISSAFVKAYMGAAGCAKTSTLCAAAWLRALLTPGSKGVVCRFNYNDLDQTTKLRMEEMLHVLPPGTRIERNKAPPERWIIQPAVEGDFSEITFMGLKDAPVGFEIDWAIVDEANEVPEAAIQSLKMRLRNPIPANAYSIMMAFNPPDKTHWLYRACTGRDEKDRKIGDPWVELFTPQARENERNLPTGYYEDKAKDLPEDLRMRFVMGEWGGTFSGQPVYREFKYAVHVKENLIQSYDPYAPLFRFWDFGYNAPACLFGQLDEVGRLLIFNELIGKKEEIAAFADRVVAETNVKFPNHEDIRDFGDPAVRQKKDTGSTLVELGKKKITMLYKISNIDEGVRLVRTRLELLIQGEAALQFDRDNCPVLISGFRGGYRLDNAGVKPHKDGYYEHAQDAFRYGCINLLGNGGDMDGSRFVPESVAYARG